MFEQKTLPGLSAPPPRRRRRSYARVWSDPTIVASRAGADHRFGDWRGAFAGWLRRLPARRRAELRRRLGLPTGTAARAAPPRRAS